MKATYMEIFLNQTSEDGDEERQAAVAAESGGVTLTTFASITFLLQLVTLLVSK